MDIALVVGLLYLLAFFRGVADYKLYHYAAFLTSVLMWFIYMNSGVYRRFKSHINRIISIAWAWARVFAVIIFIAFALKISEQFSRQVLLSWFIIGFLLQILSHYLSYALQRNYMMNRHGHMPCLMVGSHELGQHLTRSINENVWLNHKIVGVIDDDADALARWPFEEVPVLGDFTALPALINQHKIKRVYVALPLKFSHIIRELQIELLDINVDVIWAPDLFGLNLINPSVKEIAGVPLFSLSESPMSGCAAFIKALLDYPLSLIAITAFSPVMIAAAIAIKLSSPGPVIFRQKRHGLDGEVFYINKFRSMKLHEELDDSVTQTIRRDPRLTRVGAFLRKTSIDELPQLFNVLQGHMSMVGPRPHAVIHNNYYSDKIGAYMARHRIKPGITGLAQVHGCRGETDSLEKMEKRVEYDLAYINNWSVWLDIQILIKTLGVVLFSKNAY